MEHPDMVIGLPWQLAQVLLQAASIPFTVTYGQNYNKFFSLADDGYYVARMTMPELGSSEWHVLLYRPMVNSGFDTCKEVEYAEGFKES